MAWMKHKIIKKLDEAAEKLSEDIAQLDDEYDQEEISTKLAQLEKLEDVRWMVSQPRISKEVWVEIIKVLGALSLMGIAVYYDSTGHILPKGVRDWIQKVNL